MKRSDQTVQGIKSFYGDYFYSTGTFKHLTEKYYRHLSWVRTQIIEVEDNYPYY